MASRSRVLTASIALAVAGVLGLTACSSGPDPAQSGQTVTKDAAAAKLVPTDIAARGTLLVGLDPSYAPNEYVDSKGNTVGMDVDLANAIAHKLGLKAVFSTADVGTLVASVGGRFDIGISSLTDTKTREQQADFIDYYNSGTSWAALKDTGFTLDGACGQKVAVQEGTIQDTTDLAARSKKCVAAGKPAIVIQRFDKQTDATRSVVVGQSMAFLADSPVVGYAVGQSGGNLVQIGASYGNAPYGVAVSRSGGTLKDAISAAFTSLIADGTYLQILTKWHVEGGAMKAPTFNAAVS